ERLLEFAEQLAQPADDLATDRRRSHAPLFEPAQTRLDAPLVVGAGRGADPALCCAGWGVHRFEHLAASAVTRVHARPLEDRLRVHLAHPTMLPRMRPCRAVWVSRSRRPAPIPARREYVYRGPGALAYRQPAHR